MPINSQQLISTVTPISALAVYSFSAQDSSVAVSKVPANGGNGLGTLLNLPSNPSNGDTYAFIDEDGSCSPGHLIGVRCPLPAKIGVLIQASPPTMFFDTANSWAVFTYEETAQTWIVQSSTSGNAGAGSDTLFDNALGVNLTTTNSTPIVQLTVTATRTGKFLAQIMGGCTGDATSGTVTMGIAHATPAGPVGADDYDSVPFNIAVSSTQFVGVQARMDLLSVPVIIPLGQTATFAATAKASAANHLSFAAHALQFRLVEQGA